MYPELEEFVHKIDEVGAGRPLDQVSLAVSMAEQMQSLGDDLISHFVDAARTAGYSWAEMGTSLGVSRQAAQQRSRSGRFGQARMGGDGTLDKASPFGAWRLADDGGIEVQVESGSAWQGLVSLDGHPIEEVVAAARKADPRRWFKRLSEDLDEVYKELGASLGSTASAVLVDTAGRQAEREVDVTIAKRKAAWRHNNPA